MRRENPRYHSICNPYRNTTQILNAEKTEDPTAVSDLRLKSHRCLELRCRLSPAADSLKKLCPDPLYHSRCKNNNTKLKKSQGLKNRRRFFSLLSCIYSLSQLRCRRLAAALTVHRTVIHYRADTPLPRRRSQAYARILKQEDDTTVALTRYSSIVNNQISSVPTLPQLFFFASRDFMHGTSVPTIVQTIHSIYALYVMSVLIICVRFEPRSCI